ncbi:MAG: hypothetical protein QOE11_2672 [Solirubrobacteraceae bacterium]|jgi:hypothetical protein|nr:hypothetical protein [Solirubrobacteraceae bacterium]
MPTREQVLALLDEGLGYEAAGRSLGVPAGQAYLIATGLPADGSGSPTPEDLRRPGVSATSTQRLSNPPARNPTTSDTVRAWIRARAQGDAQMQQAAAAGQGKGPSSS